jgi:tetratricopeptide (TPR) repeat protein
VDRVRADVICSAVNKLAMALCVVVVVVVAPGAVVRAGTSRPNPPINVVAPTAPTGNDLEPDDLPAPQLEVTHFAAGFDLPAIPDFQLAAGEPGFHAPRELQVRGAPLLGTEIKVKGYVTWIYDCRAALASANPQLSPSRLRQVIDSDPALCEYPKLYLGDTRTTPPVASIWVVDMPRAPTHGERVMMTKDQLKAWPAVPALAVGDYVVITGTWAVRSIHAEHNSGGLLIYRGVERAAPRIATLTAAVTTAAPAAAAASEPPVATSPPLRKVVDPGRYEISIEHLNACNKAIVAKHYDAALIACQAATRAWEGNHLAWYAMTSAYMAKTAWRDAAVTIQRAVTLRPDVAMYQLYDGITCYEAARAEVHADGPRPGQGALLQASRDAARAALLQAVKLAPELWRAHYYLGRIYRELGDAGHAAEQFAAAIKGNPRYRFGYIALVELYRRWGYVDQSLIVATLGAMRVAPADAADLWLEVAMAYDAKSADDKAIAALGKALASRPDDVHAKLERGRIYVRKGDAVSAKRDLADVLKATGATYEPAKQLAAQLLGQLDGSASAAPSQGSVCSASDTCRIRAAPYSGWAADDRLSRL